MITHTGTYAIRALVYLAEARQRVAPDSNTTVAEIARATGMPHNYLTKILHGLAQAGVLDSTRGPHGGFRLTDGVERLTLKEVLAHFEAVPGRGCFLNEEGCPEGEACPSLERCLTLTGQVDRFLRTTRVVDLITDDRPAGTEPGAG